MHYRNGREAKAGDNVLVLNGPCSNIGYLVNLQPGSTSCNAWLLTTFNAGYEWVTVGDCLHMEDVMTALETTKPGEANVTGS